MPEYRELLIPDLSQVAELEQALFSHPHSLSQLEAMVTGNSIAVVAQVSGRICGYAVCSLGGGEADLLVIAVDRPMQGQGVAPSLLERLLESLRNQGVEALFLEVRASNGRAIAFYRQQGFTEIGVRRRYYPAADGVREDALLFRMNL